MAENYKHLYEQTKKMLVMYQDEIVPGFREKIEDMEKNMAEVVRCKDCKHWHKETSWCNIHSHFVDDYGMFCHPWESAEWKILQDDDFCSYGERKNNEID